VEVLFTSFGPARTQVDLVHRHIERHGEGWEQMHVAVGSEEGWLVGVERFELERCAMGDTPESR
jgi:hypothetical protein